MDKIKVRRNTWHEDGVVVRDKIEIKFSHNYIEFEAKKENVEVLIEELQKQLKKFYE